MSVACCWYTSGDAAEKLNNGGTKKEDIYEMMYLFTTSVIPLVGSCTKKTYQLIKIKRMFALNKKHSKNKWKIIIIIIKDCDQQRHSWIFLLKSTCLQLCK